MRASAALGHAGIVSRERKGRGPSGHPLDGMTLVLQHRATHRVSLSFSTVFFFVFLLYFHFFLTPVRHRENNISEEFFYRDLEIPV